MPAYQRKARDIASQMAGVRARVDALKRNAADLKQFVEQEQGDGEAAGGPPAPTGKSRRERKQSAPTEELP